MDRLEIRMQLGDLHLLEGVEEDFFISKRLHDLRDLESRDGDTSKELNIPRNPNNIRLLGSELPSFRSVFSGESTPFYVEVLLGGITVMNDATLFVIGENVRGGIIQILVVGGTSKFFNYLTEDSIRELNFAEYNVNWTLAELVTRANTNEGFLFGNNVWYSNDSIELFLKEHKPGEVEANDMYLDEIEIEAAGAWFYIKTIFLKILDGIPRLTFNTDFLTTELFNWMVVQLPITVLYDRWKSIADSMFGIVGAERAYYTKNALSQIRFDNLIDESPAGLWDAPNNQFILTSPGLIEIEFKYRFVYYGDENLANKVTTKFYYKKNEETVKTVEFPLQNGNHIIEGQASVLHYCEIGDTIRIDVLCGDYYGNQIPYKIDMLTDSIFSIKLPQGVGSSYVEVADYLPDMTQKSFVMNVLKLAHLIPVEKNNHVEFIYWDKIKDNKEQDLTQFLNTEESITKIGFIPNYGKKNIFRYAHSDLVRRSDVEAILPMDYAGAPDELTKIQSSFVPCDLTEIDDTKRVCAPLFNFEYERVNENKMNIVNASVNFSTEERHGLEPGDHLFVYDDVADLTMKRIVISITDDFIGTVDVNWTTGHNAKDWDFIKYSKNEINLQIGIATVAGNITYRHGGLFADELLVKNIYFPDSLTWDKLVEEYYKIFKDSLRRPIVSQAWFNLPLIVYKQLSIGQPAYIGGSEAAQFYINNIEQYKSGGEVRLELIKMASYVPVDLTGDFTVEPDVPINLGNWEQGDSPIIQEYTVTNIGSFDIEIHITLQGTGAGYFEIIGDTIINIAPASNVIVPIQFNGSTVAGANVCEILFSGVNAPVRIRNIQAFVQTYTYTVIPQVEVNMGIWEPGDSALESFWIVENTGNNPLSIVNTILPIGEGFNLVSPPNIELPVGDSVSSNIQFVGSEIDGRHDVVSTFTELHNIPYNRNAFVTVQIIYAYEIAPVGLVDLGDWSEGDAPLEQLYTLTNVGNMPLSIEYIFLVPGFGWESPTASPILITVGGNAQFTVQFTGSPDAGEKGTVIEFAEVNTPTQQRILIANVPIVHAYICEPVEHQDLGDWTTGDPALTQNYLLENRGNIDLIIPYVVSSGEWSIGEPSPISLANGQSKQLIFSFNGSLTPGNKQANFVLSEPNTAQLTRTTEATVLTSNLISVEPLIRLDFGDRTSEQPPQDLFFTVSNLTAVEVICDVEITDDSTNRFSFIPSSPITIPASGNVIVTVSGSSGGTTPGVHLANMFFEPQGTVEVHERELRINITS